MTGDRSPHPASPPQRRIVVTGAAGFIGSHICEVLRTKGHEVVPFVRSAARPPAGGVAVDLEDLDALVAALQAVEPDAVCHGAWSGHPRSAGVQYSRQIVDNLVPSAHLAVATGMAEVEHLILLSSGGSVGRHPVAGKPPGAYGWAKRAVESILDVTGVDFGFAVTALRPSAVYGPGQDPAGGLGVVSVFVDHVLRDEPVVLLGSGRSGRDFLHVDDLALCVERVVETGARGVFEVGGPEVVRLDDLLGMLEELFGRPVRVERAEATGLDPELVSLDNRAIEQATGWRPLRRLSEELPAVVADLAARHGIPVEVASARPTPPTSA